MATDQDVINFLDTYDSLNDDLVSIELLLKSASEKYLSLVADLDKIDKFVVRQRAAKEKEKERAETAATLKEIASGFVNGQDKAHKLRKLEELRVSRKITHEQFRDMLSKMKING